MPENANQPVCATHQYRDYIPFGACLYGLFNARAVQRRIPAYIGDHRPLYQIRTGYSNTIYMTAKTSSLTTAYLSYTKTHWPWSSIRGKHYQGAITITRMTKSTWQEPRHTTPWETGWLNVSTGLSWICWVLLSHNRSLVGSHTSRRLYMRTTAPPTSRHITSCLVGSHDCQSTWLWYPQPATEYLDKVHRWSTTEDE